MGLEGASVQTIEHLPYQSLGKSVSVRVLQSIARHANISTTQAYIDVNDAMKRKAIELV